jgi:exonuclease III
MELKIFNLNCWLLPVPFSSENKKRIKGIMEFIKKQNPDIMTLQEVWLKKDVRNFKKIFPNYKFFHSNSKLFNKSGLLFGIKWNPKSFSQSYFKITSTHSKRERIGLKGYQVVEISPGVFVINTQLYAPEAPNEMKITLLQFEEIQRITLGRKAILSGDLNLEEDEFLNSNRVFYYKSPLGFTIARKNKYCHAVFNKFSHADKTIDYIVSNDKSLAVNPKIFNPVTVSDHYPLSGTFEF